MTLDDSATRSDACLAPVRRSPSRLRHGGGTIRTFGVDLGAGALVPPQPSGWTHLVTVRTGVAVLRCGTTLTVLTPQLAAWIRDGLRYGLEFRTYSELRILYAPSKRHPAKHVAVVELAPLLRESIERATVRGYLDPENARDARVLAVIADELDDLREVRAGNTLVLPHDRALLRSAERMLASPEEPARLASFASAADMSVRTFERRFARETGRTPRDWLRRARLQTAVVALASGASVTEAAFACGYSSLSAFIAAYRAVFGTTPGRAATIDGHGVATFKIAR